MHDDLWRLRLRRDGFLRPGPWAVGSGAPAFLGKVISTGANLGVGKFMLVNPVDATGAEAESGAGTLTADASKTITVLALGPTAPATGDVVVCRHVNYRWVAEKQTPGGGSTPTPGYSTCCPSNALPATMNISWTFRSGTSAATYSNFTQSATLTYQTAPSYTWTSGVSLPPSGSRFYGPVMHSSDGQDFYYIATCGGTRLGLAIGISGSDGSACFTFGSLACSPFLASGVAGGTGGVTCGYISGFGATGDNAVVS